MQNFNLSHRLSHPVLFFQTTGKSRGWPQLGVGSEGQEGRGSPGFSCMLQI